VNFLGITKNQNAKNTEIIIKNEGINFDIILMAQFSM
jgi:hypothetical protein